MGQRPNLTQLIGRGKMEPLDSKSTGFQVHAPSIHHCLTFKVGGCRRTQQIENPISPCSFILWLDCKKRCFLQQDTGCFSLVFPAPLLQCWGSSAALNTHASPVPGQVQPTGSIPRRSSANTVITAEQGFQKQSSLAPEKPHVLLIFPLQLLWAAGGCPWRCLAHT